MGVIAIITGGLIVMTALAGAFDYLGKKAKGGGPELASRIAALESRQAALESALEERDGRIQKLDQDLAFMGRLLEDKSKPRD